ncbi:hypothetical protein StoSoilB20_21900 [Arthrobacter sp. StoSoilB20]|nr:hypothetical protein StoSoilB20_21900 [Arthrobacter sp. StoSoilB20]
MIPRTTKEPISNQTGSCIKGAFRRVRESGVSLSGLPGCGECRNWRPARSGEASVPCVLTDIALGILPYVTTTLP